MQFLSTPSARRATYDVICDTISVSISIHALREEGDSVRSASTLRPSRISIHALREEGDLSVLDTSVTATVFLSTPSARRATPRVVVLSAFAANFYPRPPRGGRRRLCGHRDGGAGFLSTPSARRATAKLAGEVIDHAISIHALREEGDSRPASRNPCPARFLSTPSARRATAKVLGGVSTLIFLSTPSARRATQQRQTNRNKWKISIHALREEGDSAPRAVCSARRNFYPRPPRGGRPKKSTNTKAKRQFLSTPSARRATTLLFLFVCRYAYFYPRPPRGGRPSC